MSTLCVKLNIKHGMTAAVINAPKDFDLGWNPRHKSTADGRADFVLCFAANIAELNKLAPAAIKLCKRDGLLWFAYPKASSKVQTNLNRDKGWEILDRAKLRGVRQISIDDTWSALRFRPITAHTPAPAKAAAERMQLGPADMGAAIMQNLKESTGKSYSEWADALRAAGITNRPAMLAWLKENGVGTVKASWIVGEMMGANRSHSNADAMLDNLFARFPEQRALYEKLSNVVMALGADISTYACATYVPFTRRRQFLVVRPSKAGLEVGFASIAQVSPKLLPSRNFGGGDRVKWKMILVGEKDLKGDFERALNLAYHEN